ncbi:LamG domain-containing protein [Asanoa iriomotensis]
MRCGMGRRQGRIVGTLLALTLGAGLVPLSGAPVAAAAETVDCSASTAATAGQAALLADACDKPVEALDARTEFEQVYVEPTGARRLVAAITAQRVHRADGSWADVDPTLRAVEGGFTPIASTADMRFSGGGAGPLVTWQEGASEFTLSWPGRLPAPRIDGDTAVYESVLPDVNLHVTALAEGFRHVLEVKTPEAAANPALTKVRFVLGGDLRPQTSPDGGLHIVDASGTAVVTALGAAMWDSATGQQTVKGGRTQATALDVPRELVSDAREPGERAATAPVRVTLAGDDMLLTPDTELLTSASTVFPLFIDPVFNKNRSKWAYESSNAENNDATAMRVGRQAPPDGSGEKYRSFFEFSVPELRGQHIVSAYMDLQLDHSFSCGATPVYLFRPGGNITVSNGGRMAWNSHPLGSGAQKLLDTWSGNANETGGCGVADQGDADVILDDPRIKTDLQAAATANWTLYTVGLCACDENGQGESDQQRWKRFYPDSTYLIVTYDLPPYPVVAQPFSQTTDCYKQCSSPAIVRDTTPTLNVTVADPYGGVLRTIFEVRTAPSDTAPVVAWNYSPWNPVNTSTPAVTTAGTSTPGTASWQVPVTLTSGTTYYWRASTGDEVGLWNDMGVGVWQTLTIDNAPPTVTNVSSSQYPLKAWGAVVNTPGTFAITGAGDAVEWTWQVDGGTVQTVTSPSVPYTPVKDMVRVLSVKAIDKAGNTSGSAFNHEFWVKPLPNRCWNWRMDEAVGATTAADKGNTDTADQLCGPIGSTVNAKNGTLSPGASFVTGGKSGNAASFTGTGKITTSGPALDTRESFTVMAWVRPSSLVSGDQTILSQDGVNGSRFQLHYDKDANAGAGGWCFSTRAADNTAAPVSACATGMFDGAPLFPPADNVWVHLAGTYDKTTSEIKVWVMGDGLSCTGEVAAATATGSWAAGGSFVIGRARSGGETEFFKGLADKVYAHQRVLAASEICQSLA